MIRKKTIHTENALNNGCLLTKKQEFDLVH